MSHRDQTPLVRAAYSLGVDEAEWLRGIVRAARAFDLGLGVLGCVIEVEANSIRRRSLVVEADDALADATLSDLVHARRWNGAQTTVLRSGVTQAPRSSAWGLIGEGGRASIMLVFPCAEGHRGWSRRDVDALDGVGAHLGAALRLRAAVREGADARSVSERLVDSSQRDGARARRVTPEDGHAFWNALLEGRWSILESVESERRRTMVAWQSEARSSSDPKLTPTQREIVRLIVLGHSFKFVAFELGMSISGVASGLRRALAALGVSSRADLIRWLRPQVSTVSRAPSARPGT